jgi:epoxyqueuosine reductase
VARVRAYHPRAIAAEIGISAIGIAGKDVRYTFVDAAAQAVGDKVIVCVLEQNWEATQIIPGPVSEQTALSTNAELIELTIRLARALQGRGFRARAHTTEGIGVVHHYAVESGLGQMGYNGQLLTPRAGSRCRLSIITTDAPLVTGAPRDFGIPGICSRCSSCVRNCPSGAIPNKAAPFRGVVKVKLNLPRCFPVVAQVHGCAICMKVCPVQRYGLGKVLDHFEETGKIVGVGDDELEGYDWPLNHVHFGPGERPSLPRSFFDVPGFGSHVSERAMPVANNPLM